MLKKLAGHFVGMKIKTNFKFSPVIPSELLFTWKKLERFSSFIWERFWYK